MKGAVAAKVLRYRCFNATLGNTPGFGFITFAEQLCGGAEPPRPLQQVFSLARVGDCNFVTEERLETNDKCMLEVKAIRGAGETALAREVIRIGLFKLADPSCAGTDIHTWPDDAASAVALQQLKREKDRGAAHCIGYLYVYRDTIGESIRIHVHAAVIARCALLKFNNKYIHSYAAYTATVLGIEFDIEGSYFAQQQPHISCCAHASVMAALKNLYQVTANDLASGYIELNQYLGFSDGLCKEGALNVSRIRALLVEHGIDNVPATASTETVPHEDSPDGNHSSPEEIATSVFRLPREMAIAYAYYGVEAGLPAIVTFDVDKQDSEEKPAHAVTVVGHTFDGSRWPGAWEKSYFEKAEEGLTYLPSYSWVDGLIVQDDNFGPYCTLPIQALMARNPQIIVPVYPWTYNYNDNLPWLAEAAAYMILTKEKREQHWLPLLTYLHRKGVFDLDDPENPWLMRFVRALEAGRAVMRTLPYTREQYLHFIDNAEFPIMDPGSTARAALERLLPENPFWLVELSVPELYQHNNRRLGEVLVFPNPEKRDAQPMGQWRQFIVRLPGLLIVTGRDTKPKAARCDGKYHYPIARSNRPSRKPDERARLYRKFMKWASVAEAPGA